MKNATKSLLIAATLATAASLSFAKDETAAPAVTTSAATTAAAPAPQAKATHAKKHRKSGSGHKKSA